MTKSLVEVASSARAFAVEWADASYERGETQSFYNDFFAIFGIRRRSVARYEEHVKKLDNTNGYIDLFWPNTLLVEQKSAGRNLEEAREQALAYFDALEENMRPRYLLLCDFQNWELLDLDLDEEVSFSLQDLPDYVSHFGFMRGIHKRTFSEQDAVNIRASELIGDVYDELLDAGYPVEALDRFLVRIVFCMFAEDAQIFEPDSFLDFLEDQTSEDGYNIGERLNTLFEVLNQKSEERSRDLDPHLAAFPYVNGGLFSERLPTPSFNRALRNALTTAARFDWSRISPAIFGSMFQTVMNQGERRAFGAHYTSEQNILKVIEPLFLDDLRSEFTSLQRKGNRRALQRFQSKLGELKFLDPACGCGNFLVVAYRELRKLELEVVKTLYDATNQSGLKLSVVDVDQFYGIEILEFPARIAETALWMMDHLMNLEVGYALGTDFARIPLERSPRIRSANALEIDWRSVLAPEECNYVFGNPPFGGFVFGEVDLQAQAKVQMERLGAGSKRLDYVATWFLLAAEYVASSDIGIGFVATSSICQGEQAPALWPALLEKWKLHLWFAHTPFDWTSEARGAANVVVVILGLRARPVPGSAYLFVSRGEKGIEEVPVKRLSPYLIDGSRLPDAGMTIRRTRQPLNGLPSMQVGTKPVDNGLYIFDDEQKREFLAIEPGAKLLFRPYVGAREFLGRGGGAMAAACVRCCTINFSWDEACSRSHRACRKGAKRRRKSVEEAAENTDGISCNNCAGSSVFGYPGDDDLR